MVHELYVHPRKILIEVNAPKRSTIPYRLRAMGIFLPLWSSKTLNAARNWPRKSPWAFLYVLHTVPLSVKHSKRGQAKSCEGEELLNECPHEGMPYCQYRLVRIYDDVINLCESYDRGDNWHDTNTEDDSECVQLFTAEAVIGAKCADCEHWDYENCKNRNKTIVSNLKKKYSKALHDHKIKTYWGCHS